MGLTIETHWDCECEKNYINPKAVKYCPKCGTFSDDQPDSRINEVKEHLQNKYVLHIGGGVWVDREAVEQAQIEGFDLINQN
jgi:hypothetical protein